MGKQYLKSVEQLRKNLAKWEKVEREQRPRWLAEIAGAQILSIKREIKLRTQQEPKA